MNVTLNSLMPENVSDAVALYESAFPVVERRPSGDWLALNADANIAFAIKRVLSGGEFVGFVSCWHFHTFIYIEHFAILPTQRGKRIGGHVLGALKAHFAPLPIVLEVELPEDELTTRRVNFYQRSGFSYVEIPYVQPPYREGGESLPLRLMGTDREYVESHFNEIVRRLYSFVYGVELKMED